MNARSFNRLASLTYLLIVLLGQTIGCAPAFNRTMSMRGEFPLKVSFSAKETKPLAITVQDIRPDVINGSISESNIGTFRAYLGAPWPVTTASGNPLAQDLAESIAYSLQQNGFQAIYIPATPFVTEESLKTTLANNQAVMKDRVLLHFILKQWHPESWFGMTFNYCVSLVGRSPLGEILTTVSECDHVKIEDSNTGFTDYSAAAATVINNLLNRPEIKPLIAESPHAIGEASPAVEKKLAPQSACTTGQILKMKSMGLTDDQVKAACH